MIVALARRRIDAADATEPRRPTDAEPAFRDRLEHAPVRSEASVLVRAAACGADLAAL